MNDLLARIWVHRLLRLAVLVGVTALALRWLR